MAQSYTYHYTVSSLAYASQEMKERLQRESYFITEERKYTGETYYTGFTLAKAQRAFWRACREAEANPLTLNVSVRRNAEILMNMTPI